MSTDVEKGKKIWSAVKSVFADGFFNTMTGFGKSGVDRNKSTSYEATNYTPRFWENVYSDNWLAKRIVDVMFDDAVRNGWNLNLEESDDQEKIANKIRTIYGREAIVCHPGTNKEWLDGGNKIVQLVKKKYGLRSKVILLTNRHVNYKKLHWAPRILKKIKKEHPDAQVVITGRFNPIYTQRIIQEAIDQDVGEDVILTNIVSDEELAGLYNACQVYHYTAIEEDWGLGIIEAMYCSKPVICWKDAGAADYIKNGINGFAHDCYDLDQMAETTSNLLGNERLQRKIGREARETASQFSWERHLQILIDTLNNLH